MKTITTGTQIIFIQTQDKFTLTQTESGFDVKQVKLSKNIPHEPYTFQELLDLYKQGQISISGFEEGEGALVESILTNYIHAEQIGILKKQLETLTAERDALKAENEQITTNNTAITEKNTQLTASNSELNTENDALKEEVKGLKYDKKELEVLNGQLTETNTKLNNTIASMQD